MEPSARRPACRAARASPERSPGFRVTPGHPGSPARPGTRDNPARQARPGDQARPDNLGRVVTRVTRGPAVRQERQERQDSAAHSPASPGTLVIRGSAGRSRAFPDTVGIAPTAVPRVPADEADTRATPERPAFPGRRGRPGSPGHSPGSAAIQARLALERAVTAARAA